MPGSGAETTVDGQAGTGDIAGFRTCQVSDEAGDFIDVAVAPDGHQRHQAGGELAVGRVHVGVYRAGLYIVDGNTTRAEVAGEAFGQAHQCGFAHGVWRATREGHAVGVGAADVDDPTPFAHVSCGGLGGDEHAAYVDGQGLVEIFEFEFVQRSHGQHAGVVDQDVQPAKGLDRGIDGVADGVGVGAVSLDRQGLAAGCGDAVLQFFRLGGRADIGECHGGAFGGQAFDDRGANAAGTALDQGDFTAQGLSIHEVLQTCRGEMPRLMGASIRNRVSAV